jgi:peptide/nickel transport system substrate-binding protein
MTKVSAQLLKNAGFNIDLQSMDWGTLVTRRALKDDPESNPKGWNIFHTTGTGNLGANPLTNNTVATPCDGKNWFGWPCDEELNKLQQQFITTTSQDDQKKLADKFQARFYEVVPFVPLGQYYQKIAYRSNVVGILETPNMPFWNIEKK